jgi:pimeloyl-ACP methyl ester carboxylesterase
MTSAVNEFPDETGLSRAEIGRVQRPASIVFGKQSRYLPTMQGLEATLANCRSTIVPNAGHYFPVLNPEVFTRAVDSFAGEYDRA